MINNIRPTSTLPYGYGIGKVGKVEKPVMDVHKEREKQNEERRANLLRQKAFIEELRRAKLAQEQQEEQEEVRHIDIRI